MRLNWQPIDKGYVADGSNYSYSVGSTVVGRNLLWTALQLRQAGGQVVNRANTATLQGAFARAQAWENDA